MKMKMKQGQSLIEILVAVGVGTIMILGAIAVIAPALKSNTQANRVQVGSALGRALLDNVRIWSEADWHNLVNLSTSSANKYYLNATSSPFTAVAGTQSIVAATTTYTRYFYVDEAFRDGSGNLADSGSLDPSSRKVTVIYGWDLSATNTIAAYFTRFRNNVYMQTDWSGGSGQDGPVTSTNSRFSTSTSINVGTSTGSIRINL